MNLIEQIAQDVVEKTGAILHYRVSITDTKGFIIGCTDKNRIGIFHEPSLEVIHKNNTVTCERDIEKKILPGISIPLKFNNEVIGVLGVVGEPSEVERDVQLVKNQVEMMFQEEFKREIQVLREKMVEMFVLQIIHYNKNENNDHILEYSRLIDFEADIERVCLLIDIDGLSKKILSHKHIQSVPFQREFLTYLKLVFKDQDGAIVSLLSMNRYIIIKPLRTKQSYSKLLESLESRIEKINSFLTRAHNVSACISVGGIGRGIEGVANSYNDAKKTMEIGKRFYGGKTFYLYNEVRILKEMLPGELSDTYQNKLLNIVQPLIDNDHFDTLSNTFITYCENNMNLSQASKNMFLHKNTMMYRLKKIEEITSIDTKSFEECMILYTAIKYYKGW
ncbi:CdaR family transcriptional regulator [Ornithinibacillus californiensis]|uniref:CdaR family transcriptional regulator n=1 Tax=Ornithinibacillus californiensis TaxID=161536 RepID=UPI00064E0088|nr:sugar diacid recognition domain-containing protein [Ornithinibacillus californiensis]